MRAPELRPLDGARLLHPLTLGDPARRRGVEHVVKHLPEGARSVVHRRHLVRQRAVLELKLGTRVGQRPAQVRARGFQTQREHLERSHAGFRQRVQHTLDGRKAVRGKAGHVRQVLGLRGAGGGAVHDAGVGHGALQRHHRERRLGGHPALVHEVLRPVALVEDDQRAVRVLPQPTHQLLQPAPFFHEQRLQVRALLAEVGHLPAALYEQRVRAKHHSARRHIVEVTVRHRSVALGKHLDARRVETEVPQISLGVKLEVAADGYPQRPRPAAPRVRVDQTRDLPAFAHARTVP